VGVCDVKRCRIGTVLYLSKVMDGKLFGCYAERAVPDCGPVLRRPIGRRVRILTVGAGRGVALAGQINIFKTTAV